MGDRLHSYMIFNEPWVFTALGYLLGTHAPGRTDVNAYLLSTHVTNLAQGMAFRAIKANYPKTLVGTAFSMSPIDPATDSPADREAAERGHRWNNVWFLQPAIYGTYPDAFVGVTPEMLGVKPGDMEKVRAPLDFIGINNYFRFMATPANSRDVLLDPFKKILPVNLELGGPVGPKTDMGWEVYPHGLYEIVMRITKDYKHPIIEITENGCAYGDAPDKGGVDNDERRIDFYCGYPPSCTKPSMTVPTCAVTTHGACSIISSGRKAIASDLDWCMSTMQRRNARLRIRAAGTQKWQHPTWCQRQRRQQRRADLLVRQYDFAVLDLQAADRIGKLQTVPLIHQFFL